jgi:3-hydroxyacyl-CoA dehydrogenase
MTNRNIKKVAVLGSGVMGSRIACHFANVGTEVLLLDIVPPRKGPAEQDRQRRAGRRAQEQPRPICDKALRQAHQHRQLRR